MILRYLSASVLLLACLWVMLLSVRVQFSVASGMLLLGLAHLAPLRKQEEKWDLYWDTVGWLAATLFAVVATTYLRIPLQKYLGGAAALQHYHDRLRSLPAWLAVVLILVLMDVFYYWGHRATHRQWLWNQHAWHHSPRYLTWLSGSRTTFVNHIVLMGLPVTLVGLLIPMPRAQWAVVFIIAGLRLVDHLHHTNLYLPWARQIEYVFITPRLHFIHHSHERRYSDSNYGLIFTFCDRLFGTFTDPDSVPESFPLGLNYRNSNWRLLLGLPPKG